VERLRRRLRRADKLAEATFSEFVSHTSAPAFRAVWLFWLDTDALQVLNGHAYSVIAEFVEREGVSFFLTLLMGNGIIRFEKRSSAVIGSKLIGA
jgi:hypothetical protein